MTVEDGLSNNSVQCLLQDKNGIVWIGTNSGLNRYDGALFIQYNLLSNPALSSSVITSLMEDDNGKIWVGTENGINILDPVKNTVQQFTNNKNDPASLPPGPVRSIKKMKNGSTWIMSERWFAEYKAPRSFSIIAIDPSLQGTNRVFAGIAEGEANQLWISFLDQPTILATNYKGANGRDSIVSSNILWPDYSRIYIDANHTVWGISHTGVKRFNKKTGSFEPWIINQASSDLSSLHVHTCYNTDANGTIWQGSQGINLAQYDLKQKKITDYNWLLQLCKATMVNCIYTDKSNTIWVGTDNGIIKLSNRTSFFKSIPFTIKGQEIKNIRCRRIMEDKYGSLYAGTENYGFIKLIPSSTGGYSSQSISTYGGMDILNLPLVDGKITVPGNGMYDIGFMYDIWYDSDHDKMWLSGYGLAEYDIATNNMTIYLADENFPKKTESITQFSICHDDSLIWTGGLHNLFTFNRDVKRLVPFYDNKGNMPFHEIACWSLAKKGNWIWAGTDKGLYKINKTTHEVNKIEDPALQLSINDIFVDTDSSFWISTAGGGIVHFSTESGKLAHYTTRDGLSNNTVCGLLADEEDNLWISTYAGLNYFNRQTNLFASFYAKDGLNGDEFNRKAFSRLKNGDLVFGGLNGYNIFKSRDAFIDYKSANLLLTSFTKTTGDGTVVENIYGIDAMNTTVIDPGDKFLSFTFTLTDMYDPASNRYSYKLEGLDNQWHYIGNQHNISFMSLPAGKYTLRVKGSSAKYLVAKNELAIAIRVKQVFYKSAWFIILVVLATAALVYGVVRYRLRQLQKVQALRTRIASDLHDEIGSNLVRITMLADAGKREHNETKLYEQMGLIAGISRGAVSTMKDVIWNIDARNDTMEDMVSYMHEHIHNMLTPAGIEFSFQHAGVPGDKKPDINFRQNVYLIFKEAINNIVKHSGADYVQVTLEQKRGMFRMIIKDNGKGLVEKSYSAGQGLNNMKMRAARIGASLEIVSKEGVLITLEVPD